MSLPHILQDTLEQTLNITILNSQWVTGGDINQAARVDTRHERFFVKWNYDAPADMFQAEAQGLELLARTQAIRVPHVILWDQGEAQIPAFLVLEWLDFVPPQDTNLLAERLGEGLALLHQFQAQTHGLERDNFIGSLPQRNTPTANWADFFAEQRLGFQQQIAHERGRMTPERERLLNDLRADLPDLLPNAEASLLHGDLWGGNYMCLSGDIPAIYDPAVYFGHREVELAFTELFGKFPTRFYQAYDSIYPLDPQYDHTRKQIYQLYPLMVHLNLFGGHYGRVVDEIARRFVGKR